jgi:RNA polymerase sigma-70 factor, ECF subfamily
MELQMSGEAEREFDRTRFDALFADHYAELHRFAQRRLVDRGAVEDVLAETFATAWRRRDAMPDPALPWLFGVCIRVISTHRRTAKRRSRLYGRVAANDPQPARDPADVYAERDEISRAFATLSDSHREVLRLVAWDGLSTAEAAAVLDCSPAAFRVRLHRARRELEKHLGSAGHEPVPAPAGAETR